MEITDLEARLRREAPGRDTPPGASELAPHAAAAGLLDVAYALHETPVGRLLLAATATGLVRVAYADAGPEPVLDRLAAKLSPRILHHPGRLDTARRELDEYFGGRRREFDLDLDWSLTRGFGRRVLQATARVPFGAWTTYGGVAAKAGSARGFRAAGNALGANPLPIVVPCHRVLAAGGGLGGYTGGVDRKRKLLEVEGLTGIGGG